MRRLIASLFAVIAVKLGFGGPGQALADPLYDVKATWGDTNLTPGGAGQFAIQVRNIGDETGGETLQIVNQLPSGVVSTDIYWSTSADPNDSTLSKFCAGVGTKTLLCEVPAALLPELAEPPGSHPFTPSVEPSGYLPTIYLDVLVAGKAAGEGTNTATVKGGSAAVPRSDVDAVPFDKEPAAFGVAPGSFLVDLFTAAFPFGEPARQASDRPFELRVKFDLAAKTGVNDGSGGDASRYITSNGQLRTVEVTVPRGMIGNPEAIPKCDPTDFAEIGTVLNSTACPPNTQLGYLEGSIGDGVRNYGRGCCLTNIAGFVNRVPLYNLEPPKGVPADLAFNAGGLVQGHIYPLLDPAQSYAIKTVTPNITTVAVVKGTEATFWGVPGDPAHDKFRYPSGPFEADPAIGAPFGGAPIRPFFTNPMDCGFDNGGARIRIDSYNDPGQLTAVQEYGDHLNVTGCEDPRFRFEPEISLQPTSRDAGGPTGLDVNLEVPQRNDEVKDANELYAANGDVQAIATPPVKKAVVTLPEGMTLSPSAAQGLEGCSSEQIALGTDLPVKCPDASQYGTLTLHTPLLPVDEQPEGWIYIAKQDDNPFHNFLSLYLVIQEPDRGILVKLPGRVDLDPLTGQIVTTFDDLPQFPVSDFALTLKGGVRAALVNPATCGTKTIKAEFYSWHDPSTPLPVKDSYEVTAKADGSPCVGDLSERSFSPTLKAGTLNNSAGAYSPFLFRLTRTDEDQEFSQLGVSLPQGIVAKIAGIEECSEAGIAQAIARTGRGQGALELISSSCPASSYIGSTQAGAGVGVPLTYVPGKIFLGGSYQGAPLSMVVVTAAIVGPYDLGVIAVRAAIHFDSETAEVAVQSDPFPLIYQGIPVRLRDIRVAVDRPETTLNPTSCEEKRITARITGTGGNQQSTADDTAIELSTRFQAAECASLDFAPKLSFRLFGGSKRGSHPRLRAVLRLPSGGANMASASIALPRSEFLDQSHIRTVCTRVQFRADACPQGAIYGFSKAKSPLLEDPLEGPVYLRSSSNKLPDLIFALKGRIDFDAVGRIDSVRGGIRNTFDFLPDAPVEWVVVDLQGGRKGLLINSRNLCKGPVARATAVFVAQNGRRVTLHPQMRASCGGKGKARKRLR